MHDCDNTTTICMATPGTIPHFMCECEPGYTRFDNKSCILLSSTISTETITPIISTDIESTTTEAVVSTTTEAFVPVSYTHLTLPTNREV